MTFSRSIPVSPMKKIEEDCDRDNWMSSAEAREYGLVDEVLDRNNPKGKG